MEIYAWIESVFQIAVQYGILAMEALGMAVLLVTAARSASRASAEVMRPSPLTSPST